MFPLLPSSFGDVVAAASLAAKVFKALSDSTGSSFEYQSLVGESNALSNVLKLVEIALRSSTLNHAVVEGINAEAVRCRLVLEKLWDKIKGYQKTLGCAAEGSWTKSSWRKIGWGLFKADDIESFRSKLSAHREIIAGYLSASIL